ncbi:MAG: diguanylate cyclase [Frankiales bacterium]|nr:diguanylate cyclase [Frankiales bacterium]
MILYVIGGLVLLGSVNFLPQNTDKPAVVGVAILTLVSAIAMLLLPWHRFPVWVTRLPLLWGIALVTLLGSWAGALAHFVLFYEFASLYVGLTQGKGSWVWVAPVNLLSVSLALLGNEPSRGSGDIIGAAFLSVIIGEVLARAIGRAEEANKGTARLLAAVTSLHQMATEEDAADKVAGLAHTLLAPDSVIVMVADRPGSLTYVNRGQRGVRRALGSLAIDRTGGSGLALALNEGRAIFEGNATGSPMIVQDAVRQLVAQLGFRSLLFIPVPGEGGYLGCVIVAWKTQRQHLSHFEEQVVSLLSEQAGTLLERLRNVGHLQHQARTDALTGLANRRTFLESLDRLRPGGAVVFLDLDHFKQLNDEHGHQAGDDALTDFAQALKESVREGDCAARYGGEEFALVLPSAASVDMTGPAETVVKRLRGLWKGPVTFSVGIAVHRQGDAPSTTLARADGAVYAAKAAGRNTLVIA